MPVQYCTNHPKRETLRICGRCERPFCPDCLVNTPVGGRCRECARGPAIARMRVAWWRWPVIAACGFGGGAIGMVVASMAMWFMLIVCIVVGQALATAVLWASGRKPGAVVAWIGVAAIVAGGMAAGVWTGLGIFQIVGVALMAGSAYQRLQ